MYRRAHSSNRSMNFLFHQTIYSLFLISLFANFFFFLTSRIFICLCSACQISVIIRSSYTHLVHHLVLISLISQRIHPFFSFFFTIFLFLPFI
ncbi:hypothetical protein C2G38_2075810 [Gigaspora rosea]|uniref:TLC domain-containing protein n=1 Tax=Gigaspora rosea TaxID=44941 RepID=A0A397VTK8_9GLOM|nr:hypothetical protein C2G38_2075810 [Gigaspora rosea]